MPYEEKGHYRDFLGEFQINTANLAPGRMIIYDGSSAQLVYADTGGGEVIEARSPLLKSGTIISILTDGNTNNFLRGDGVYSVPSGQTITAGSPILFVSGLIKLNSDGNTANFLNGLGYYSAPSSGGSSSKPGLNFTFSSNVFAPLDATNYFWSCYQGWSALTLAGTSLFVMPMSGIIKSAYVSIVRAGSPQASVQASTMLFRINNISSTNLFTAVNVASAINVFSSLALNIGITAGDRVEIQWITPTWTANPLAVRPNINFYME